MRRLVVCSVTGNIPHIIMLAMWSTCGNVSMLMCDFYCSVELATVRCYVCLVSDRVLTLSAPSVEDIVSITG